MSGVARAVRMISEPRAINTAQIILYIIAAAAGLAAAVGALNPLFTSATVGPWIIITVGIILALGGITGGYAVIAGLWWVERIALIVLGVSWIMLLPAALFFAFSTHNSAIWLVIALLATAVLSLFIRYRRIDWAYLDPTR
jgi:hypothetical protein